MRNDNPDYRASLCVACRSGRSASGLEVAARRRSVTRSVTNGIPTLERAERSSQLSCGAPRRDLHSHAGACGTIIPTIVRRSASHAVLDALRPVLRLRRG
ncbi:hypothetical protein ALP09_04538, partial [Pseudomonas amygdali pv. lachrymans]